MPAGPSPPASRLRSPSHRLTWRCVPLPVSAQHPGRERRPPPVPLRHRAHRLADEHGGVGGGDRVARRDRQLELALGVLRMELLQVAGPAPRIVCDQVERELVVARRARCRCSRDPRARARTRRRRAAVPTENSNSNAARTEARGRRAGSAMRRANARGTRGERLARPAVYWSTGAHAQPGIAASGDGGRGVGAQPQVAARPVDVAGHAARTGRSTSRR